MDSSASVACHNLPVTCDLMDTVICVDKAVYQMYQYCIDGLVYPLDMMSHQFTLCRALHRSRFFFVTVI